MKKWKRIAALSSAVVMATATLSYFPSDTLQNIRLEISASAETTTEPQVWIEDNLTWKLYADGTLNISGTGAMKNYDTSDNQSPACLNSDVTKIVIEEGVTSIGDSAFYRCDNLTSITIPGNVESIGEGAFYNCGLKDVTIQDGVKSIGDNAFMHCGSLERITISNSVTSIGEYAFYNCRSLTSITIPDGVTSIGGYAFGECSSLTSITILDGVTSIGDYAFELCNNLTSITIPDSVTSIGESAFYGCSSLKTISLSCGSPLKRTDFGEQADLVSYTNQHTLTKTAAKAATCTEDGNKEYWTCKHCGKYFLSDDTNPETAKAVEQSETILSASHELTKVEAKAATCTEDGNKEYWTCKHCGKYFLSDDTNPETATAVEQSETILSALKHKNAIIQNAAKPTGTTPGYSGDRYCPDCDMVLEKGYTYWIEDNLTWKLYADGTLNISGTGAMKNYNTSDNKSPACVNLDVTSIVIEEGVTSIGDSAFYRCDNLTSITIPGNVESIGEGAFYNCGLKDVTIQDGVKSIGDSAFIHCSSLERITIPNSVTTIGQRTFYNCSSLTSITIPNSVTTIGESAFGECSGLTSITIPDSVTSIGYCAFNNCSSLTSITIPDSVTSIGESAFNNCTNLKTISLSCGSPLKRTDFGEQADLVSYTNQHTLTKTAAKAATCTEDGNKEYWTCKHCGKYFLSDDTNPETATAVEQSEFIIPALNHKNAIIQNASQPTETAPGYSGDRYCPDCDKVVEKGYTYWVEDNLTWKLYEDGTLNISGKGAMKNYDTSDNRSPVFYNYDITSIVIEEGVTSIGDYAFYLCRNTTSITIPKTVKSIGAQAFYDCGLTSVTIPGNVESIGESAFYYCINLTDVTLQDGVKSIGRSAFIWCGNLTNIVLPNSITSIGFYAFKDCTSLTSITIPSSVISMDSSAFYNCSSLETISLDCGSSLKRTDFGEQADLVSYMPHTLIKIEAKDSADGKDGNITHWTCSHCGKYFLSDDTNPETATAVDLLEILIHNYNKNGFCEKDNAYQPAVLNEETGNYEISNAGQLYWFAEKVNEGNRSANAVLTADIIVNSDLLSSLKYDTDGNVTNGKDFKTWIPIGGGNGYSSQSYTGNFDGQGHTISGLYCESGRCVGLFGLLGNNATVKNVGIIDSSLSGTFAAGICAENEGTIANCYSNSTITGDCAAGVCVLNDDTITNCYNNGIINGVNYGGGVCAGNNEGTITNCYNRGTISGNTLGGVCVENYEGTITNCYYLENCNAKGTTFSNTDGTSKTAEQFASGEVTYLLNGNQSDIHFYQDLSKETYPTLQAQSKVVVLLTMIYDESFEEDATIKKIYCNVGDSVSLESSPDGKYVYQYFVEEKQIAENTYKVAGKTEITVKKIPAEIKLSDSVQETIQLTYQKKMSLDLTEYIENFADLKPIQFQLDADSKLPEGLTLTEEGVLSGTPKKAAENVKTTLLLTVTNGTTTNLELTFQIAKADPTVEVKVGGDSHTEGDLVADLELILSENSTKGVVELVSEIKALIAGENTLSWEFTPEDDNYNTVTGTVIVNAQTTTTTTTTTTKPNTTTTTKATTTKPNTTTTTKTTTTKPNTTTTTKATTTTKPSKTTTTKVTTTTKPSKTTTTNATTTTKPSKTTTTKVTTTTKPSKTTTTNATTTTKPSKTTTTNATTTTKPSKTTTTNATTTTKPSKTTTTKATTTTKPNKTTTTKVTTTTITTTTNTAIPSYGDVNLDGKVDIVDAIFLNKYLATLIQFSDAQMANADCCQDGVLNDQDTTALMQFIILLIDDLPVQPTEK